MKLKHIQNFVDQIIGKAIVSLLNSMTISTGEIDLSNGNLTLDVAASDIILDAFNNTMRLQDDGTNFGRIINTGDGNIELQFWNYSNAHW